MTAPLTNRLLDALPETEKRSLLALLVAVPLPLHTVLFESFQRPKYVHFITSGMASVVTAMEDGSQVEVGVCGREGFPESVYTLGPETGSKRCMMQIGGTGLRMSFQRFEQEFHASEAIRRLVLRFVQYESLVLSQLAACNRLHDVEERLARWLLIVQERIEDSHLSLTQEFLGQMLGTRRSSVTLAAGNLQRAGLIEYRRADIRIEDQEKMKDVACECTVVIQQLYDGLYR